ncbi:hypothetical protein BH18ACT6_BH18ACT6_11740 [soil metagenome]
MFNETKDRAEVFKSERCLIRTAIRQVGNVV